MYESSPGHPRHPRNPNADPENPFPAGGDPGNPSGTFDVWNEGYRADDPSTHVESIFDGTGSLLYRTVTNQTDDPQTGVGVGDALVFTNPDGSTTWTSRSAKPVETAQALGMTAPPGTYAERDAAGNVVGYQLYTDTKGAQSETPTDNATVVDVHGNVIGFTRRIDGQTINYDAQGKPLTSGDDAVSGSSSTRGDQGSLVADVLFGLSNLLGGRTLERLDRGDGGGGEDVSAAGPADAWGALLGDVTTATAVAAGSAASATGGLFGGIATAIAAELASVGGTRSPAARQVAPADSPDVVGQSIGELAGSIATSFLQGAAGLVGGMAQVVATTRPPPEAPSSPAVPGANDPFGIPPPVRLAGPLSSGPPNADLLRGAGGPVLIGPPVYGPQPDLPFAQSVTSDPRRPRQYGQGDYRAAPTVQLDLGPWPHTSEPEDTFDDETPAEKEARLRLMAELGRKKGEDYQAEMDRGRITRGLHAGIIRSSMPWAQDSSSRLPLPQCKAS